MSDDKIIGRPRTAGAYAVRLRVADEDGHGAQRDTQLIVVARIRILGL